MKVGSRRTYQLRYPAPDECPIKPTGRPERVEQVALHQRLGCAGCADRRADSASGDGAVNGMWTCGRGANVTRQFFLGLGNVENVQDSP